MTKPRRKLDAATVRQLRAEYRARREAQRQIQEARRVLMRTRPAGEWARSLQCNPTAVLRAARGFTYKDVPA
jgi:hypothetical protein